jgi:hypothetical protein
LACALALVGALLPMPAAASPSPSNSTGERPPSIMKLASDELAKPMPAGATPAATSAPSAAPPTAAPAAAAGTARPNREVFGFAQAGALGPSSGRGWNTWDYSLLTTVAYFGLHVNSGDGNLVQVSNGTTETGWGVWNSTDVGDMINAAHGAGARVVLTIVSQENSTNMCQSLLHASTTISWAVQQMRGRHVDGINVDYESGNGPCGGSDNRTLLRSLVANLRAQMDSDGVHHHLTVDTYASSAADSGGFYDVAGMAPSVDAFFVMAYPLDDSNWSSPPLTCNGYCFSPTSPASAYRYNDDLVAQQYSAAAGAYKTILGLPYFGYAACVTSWSPNAYPQPGAAHWTVPTMWTLDGIASAPNISSYVEHVDVYDHVSRYATYHGSGTDMNGAAYDCNREFYVDSAASLGAKYDIVNNRGLAGAGIWSLDYGGGIPALWNQIATHFTLRPTAAYSVTACPSASSAFVSWAPSTSSGGPITSYTVTASPGGVSQTVPGTATGIQFRNLTPGAAYSFTVQASNAQGTGPISVASGAVTPSAAATTTFISWYDHASPGMAADNLHIVNPGGAAASGCAYVSGVAVLPFAAPASGATIVGFPQGVIGGPVVISVWSGPAVLAAQRVQYNQSFNQVAARSQVGTTLYLPWYDHASPGMWNDNIHVINPDPSQAADVTISGPGPDIVLHVPAAAGSYASWPAGTIGGPVVIRSNIGVLASQRVQFDDTFNEVPARPDAEAATALVMPWYDRASPGMWNDNIHLVNPNATASAVTISIASGPSTSIAVPAHGTAYAGFPSGTIGGPITVSSTNGVSVLGSQRVQYYGSFNESPAVVASAGRPTQWLPWYDSASLGMVADNIHLLNPTGTLAHVTLVSPMGTITVDVPAQGEQITGWPGRIGGPVLVNASGAGVIASERVQFYSSFNEALGLS